MSADHVHRSLSARAAGSRRGGSPARGHIHVLPRIWPGEISALDPQRFEQDRWLSSRQITDADLLGLAVQRGGVFVTLDRSVDRGLVRGAQAQHLAVI
jgi:hypothetical protein